MTIRPISIILCTHNRADKLPSLISELRAQEYPADAFEIIVVDNGSTDQTPQVINQFIAEPGVSIRYVVENRLGVTFARNRGAEEARYPYLAYLDDDCTVDPSWLFQLVQGFDLHDDVVVVGGRVELDWSKMERPEWSKFGRLEPWLGGNSHLGSQPRLLDAKTQVLEGNMAVKREAWQLVGGFLGMDQFGSRHMAAGEVLYLLEKLRQQGGRVALAPGAVAYHHIGFRNQRWMLWRAYWQGVSDGLLDYLIYKRSWASRTGRLILDIVAMFVLFGYACFSYLKADHVEGLFHLMRVLRRLGLILSGLRLVGDWPRTRAWASAHRLEK